METFAYAMWYALGQIDAMNGLGVLTETDAAHFASYMLNQYGTSFPPAVTVRSEWQAWADQRIEATERTT